MDAQASVESVVTDAIPHEKSEKSFVAMEAEDVVHVSSPPLILSEAGDSGAPVTPDSSKESLDFLSKFPSPLTLVTSPPTADIHCSGPCLNEDDASPCTPREDVFDPFAPGPDDLLLAPRIMKHLEEPRTYVTRSLNFNHVMNNDGYAKLACAADDEMLLQTLYDTFLEAIVSKQAEDILAEVSTLGLSTDEPKTPPFAPSLTAIADTCPGAPLKPPRKSRNIDLSLCRKLEFDF